MLQLQGLVWRGRPIRQLLGASGARDGQVAVAKLPGKTVALLVQVGQHLLKAAAAQRLRCLLPLAAALSSEACGRPPWGVGGAAWEMPAGRAAT